MAQKSTQIYSTTVCKAAIGWCPFVDIATVVGTFLVVVSLLHSQATDFSHINKVSEATNLEYFSTNDYIAPKPLCELYLSQTGTVDSSHDRSRFLPPSSFYMRNYQVEEWKTYQSNTLFEPSFSPYSHCVQNHKSK
jgi:hypothetical protein